MSHSIERTDTAKVADVQPQRAEVVRRSLSFRLRFDRARRCGVLWRRRLGVTGLPDAAHFRILVNALHRRVEIYQDTALARPADMQRDRFSYVVFRGETQRCPLVTLRMARRPEHSFEELTVLGMALYASPSWRPFQWWLPKPVESPGHAMNRNLVGQAFAEGFLYGDGGCCDG